jgi:diguanylate cyclase (GGDEF)-like protein
MNDAIKRSPQQLGASSEPHSSSWLAWLLFGRTDFSERGEYREFQFKFLSVVLLSGALFTLLFVVGAYTRINPMDGSPHLHSMSLFTLVTLLLWAVIRGHPERYYPVAWGYALVCQLEYVSALAFVPQDELRILWFYTNVPGVYILLGQRAGLAISLLSIVGLALGNAHLSRPYSDNAIATALVSLAYLTMFFHVYGSRSISYFVRMRQANRQLQQLASHDMLTGVLNARAYYQRCDALIQLAVREKTPFAVLFVDLDHFKSVNDTYGHSAGDAVLRSVATCLGENLRRSDALGRIGGEEFSVFLPATSLQAARQLAESIRQAVEALMPDIGEKRLRITASIGVAASSATEPVSMQRIQQHADAAMYVAKAGGRNRVSCFTELEATPSLGQPASPAPAP